MGEDSCTRGVNEMIEKGNGEIKEGARDRVCKDCILTLVFAEWGEKVEKTKTPPKE